MSDTKFTPGPWERDSGEADFNMKYMIYCDDATGQRVADCNGSMTFFSDEERTANAALIAAAPDMYKALEEMIESMESDFAPGYGSEWHIKAIRALGKAGGG